MILLLLVWRLWSVEAGYVINWTNLISLWISFSLFLSGNAQAAIAIKPGKQAASISFKSELGPDRVGAAEWMTFCERFAKHLSLQEGGFLSSYKCEPVDAYPSKAGAWQIQVIEAQDSLDLQLSFVFKTKIPQDFFNIFDSFYPDERLSDIFS